MFDSIIAYMAIAVISSISRSYREDVILSLLVLIPIVLIEIIYTRTKYKKMGKTLVKLRKTPSVLHGIRASLGIVISLAIFIVTVNYFGNHRIGIPWIILFTFQILYRKSTETFLQEGLMDNGICASRRLIDWDTVQSYKWTVPRAKKDYFTLKIEYSKFYAFHVAYLRVFEEHKEEVDGLMKKMVSA
ncbi:MAG: hypothetical protein P4L59_18210 [Desulfosporosinus sp.]|nr:hypothetical protein [Desulfosporosinus sp.]